MTAVPDLTLDQRLCLKRLLSQGGESQPVDIYELLLASHDFNRSTFSNLAYLRLIVLLYTENSTRAQLTPAGLLEAQREPNARKT